MFYIDVHFLDGSDDPFSFRVQSEVKVVEGEVQVVEDFKPEKLLGLLSGTIFRVWDSDEAVVFEVLEPGRAATPDEKSLESPGPIAAKLGRNASSIFPCRKGAWKMSPKVGANFDQVFHTIRSLDAFDIIRQGSRT